MIEATIGRIASGEDLSFDEMSDAVEAIMTGKCQEQEIGLLLTGLRMKGESVSEIAGAAATLRRHMTTLQTSRDDVLDTCGTGGDRLGTFNISTAAALVTAAAGVPVAKHGNRAASSKSGSSDVLTELGVNVDADLDCVRRCLDELGICFCFAPLYHAAMRHVAPVRQKLGVPTIFNLLGPLANPAAAKRQLIGVAFAAYRPLVAEAAAMLGTQQATVVCGADGIDEVSITGPTEVSHLVNGAVGDLTWQPRDFGLSEGALDALMVDSPAASAAMIRDVLAGQVGPPRDIVIANAAAALWTAGSVDGLEAGATRAAEAIDTGTARELLERLAEWTRR